MELYRLLTILVMQVNVHCLVIVSQQLLLMIEKKILNIHLMDEMIKIESLLINMNSQNNLF